MKIKKRSHRCNINRPRPRHGHKYSKYKKCLSMMMVMCIEEHLSNIWRSVYDKVKLHRGWVEKKRLIIKKAYNLKDKEFADDIIFSMCEQFLIPLKEAGMKVSIPDFFFEQWSKSVEYAIFFEYDFFSHHSFQPSHMA